MRQKLLALADVLFTFLFFYVASITIHEASHYIVGEALGYTAEAHFIWWGGYVLFHQTLALAHIVIIGVSGGLITGLLLLGMSYFTTDWEQDLVLHLFIPLQLIYAGFEVLYLLTHVPLWVLGTVPTLLALGVFLLYRYTKSLS